MRIVTKVAGAVVAVLLFGFASAALAEWVASGTGFGYAKSTTTRPLSTSAATATESLYPGASGPVVLKVTNSNIFSVMLTGVTGNGAITSDKSGCAASDFVHFTDATNLNKPIGPHTTVIVTLPGAVAMTADAPTACQGAVFTIPVGLTTAAIGTPSGELTITISRTPPHDGDGNVMVNPDGLSCASTTAAGGQTCGFALAPGVHSIVAAPSTGSAFTAFQGGCPGTLVSPTQCDVTINSGGSVSVTVLFDPDVS